MIFGLFDGGFKGSIQIILPKTNFALGETIQGQLKLTLDKPVKAKQLYVNLVAIESMAGPIIRQGGA